MTSLNFKNSLRISPYFLNIINYIYLSLKFNIMGETQPLLPVKSVRSLESPLSPLLFSILLHVTANAIR